MTTPTQPPSGNRPTVLEEAAEMLESVGVVKSIGPFGKWAPDAQVWAVLRVLASRVDAMGKPQNSPGDRGESLLSVEQYEDFREMLIAPGRVIPELATLMRERRQVESLTKERNDYRYDFEHHLKANAQLRSDLAAVTVERDAMRAVVEAARQYARWYEMQSGSDPASECLRNALDALTPNSEATPKPEGEREIRVGSTWLPGYDNYGPWEVRAIGTTEDDDGIDREMVTIFRRGAKHFWPTEAFRLNHIHVSDPESEASGD